ncbi:MAG: hypothetical protein MRZ90_00815 [Candidatus Gastranaerophilales bacterium]|nr:hypothetical protein [Candidatus Gastranaerophilales bacterium]
MINNISQLNNLNIYKPQNGQKIPNLSFKADSVEISDKDKKKNERTIIILSLLLSFTFGMLITDFCHLIYKPKKM